MVEIGLIEMADSKKMSERDMRRLAELAQDFYIEKQEESGMIDPIRKAWAANEEGGLLIIISCWGKHSRELARQTGIPWNGIVDNGR